MGDVGMGEALEDTSEVDLVGSASQTDYQLLQKLLIVLFEQNPESSLLPLLYEALLDNVLAQCGMS
jgi:hypothetical protein